MQGDCIKCPKTNVRCVDHNRTTGAVRGCLCRWCNFAIGGFEKARTLDWFDKAKAYMERDP